jgi:single-strand DNA-binding protein
MGYLNKVLLIGRLGQEPEKRVTPAGHSVVNISLATSEYFKDQAGNKQDKTEWHRLVFWNRLAEILEQYCKKGSQIFVEGSLQTREWQDKDGNKKSTTEIVVRSMQMLDGKPEGGGSYQKGGQQSQSQASDPYNAPPASFQNNQAPAQGNGNVRQDDFIEDDIPF